MTSIYCLDFVQNEVCGTVWSWLFVMDEGSSNDVSTVCTCELCCDINCNTTCNNWPPVGFDIKGRFSFSYCVAISTRTLRSVLRHVTCATDLIITLLKYSYITYLCYYKFL